MANWEQVAMATILADGKIDDAEVKVLRKELYADGKIDMAEVKFLIGLRNLAQKKAKAKKRPVNPTFEKMFFKAIEDNVLKDGKIDASEVKWLEDMLFADGKIDANERKFLAILKKKAKSVHDSFDKLCEKAAKVKTKPKTKAKAKK
jgi:hypothetical protein